jgi:hypothetical protein
MSKHRTRSVGYGQAQLGILSQFFPSAHDADTWHIHQHNTGMQGPEKVGTTVQLAMSSSLGSVSIPITALPIPKHTIDIPWHISTRDYDCDVLRQVFGSLVRFRKI